VVLSEPFLLLCRNDNPLADQVSVTWQALEGAKLVLQDYASGSRPLIDAALAEQQISA
jgi:DNA-binding transcriptional LysR family regulator